MKYLKSYSSFLILESLGDEQGIKHSLVPKTQHHINKNLTQLLRLDKKSISFIGGAGKGVSEELAFDINVCLDKTKLTEENNIQDDKILEFVQTQITRLGLKSEIKKSEDRIIVQWPIEGSKKNGIVETSIQLTEHINWVSFSRYSPDLNESKSKFSGKYREALLKAITESLKKQVTAYFDDKDTVKEYREYSYNVHKGLFYETRSFEGKNGVLSKSRLLEEKRRLITSDPSEFVKAVFGEKSIPDNFMTFEQCWEEFEKNKFFNKKRDVIERKFKQNLVNMKLQIPENLK